MMDIIPRSIWEYPSSRLLPSIWGDDNDNWLSTSSPSGLSVSEDDKNVYIEAAVPGIDPDKVDVTYDKGSLWIKGEAEQEEKEKGRKYYRKSSQSFSYRVMVPGEVDNSIDPQVSCKNGVMKIAFAKKPQAQPKKLKVHKS